MSAATQKPLQKPARPFFSSGPCAKRPGWSVDAIADAYLGRSHRAAAPKAQLKAVIDTHKELLAIPDDYYVGIVPASDTGAFEMAMWSVLGARGTDVYAWESFSETWLKDIVKELKLANVRTFEADYGDIPDLSAADADRDIVFVWNGTTSGVRVPDADWISDTRTGLTLCDATSAVFAYDMPWEKLDITTWSWQKVLGGEAAHGMIVLSPRAVERLETYTPSWPMPKIFRLTKGGKLNKSIFEGSTINTPSMMAVADCMDALQWVKDIGGLKATMQRSADNLAVIEDWVDRTEWVDFLAQIEDVRSSTSICLQVTDEWFAALNPAEQGVFVKSMIKPLDRDGIAYDIASYRDAPAGLRIWGGATVDADDIKALLPWLDWAYETAKADYGADAV